jgi:hypothetical protein
LFYGRLFHPWVEPLRVTVAAAAAAFTNNCVTTRDIQASKFPRECRLCLLLLLLLLLPLWPLSPRRLSMLPTSLALAGSCSAPDTLLLLLLLLQISALLKSIYWPYISCF